MKCSWETRVVGTVVLGAVLQSTAVSQSVRSLVREGNSQYKSQKYTDAEVSYRKALEKEQELVPGAFNLGNALYKQEKADEAVKAYESAAAKSEDKETKANAYFNMGDALMKGQHYQEAVKSYIESLRLNPADQDTKYNLSYALAKMREQQQQQESKNDKNNKDNKDKKQDQQKQDQQRQDQEKQQQQDPQQQKQQSQERKMAKAEAERILDVLKNNEKDVQKKLRVRQGVRVKTDKDW